MPVTNVNDLDLLRRINKVLTLYYVEGRNQAEVGRQLGLSTAKVNRLLHQASDQGMVEIKIRTPVQHLFELETRLRTIFDLEEAVVIPAVTDESMMVHTLGRAAASELQRQIKSKDTLCIGGGMAVYSLTQAIEAQRKMDVRVVPLTGGVQGQVQTDVNYLAASLAESLGGTAYQLHAPTFVDTATQREQLVQIRQVKEILDMARGANVAVFGVGTVSESSRFVQFTSLLVEDIRQIANECGVGEIAARILDIGGRPCATNYSERVVGLTLDEIKRIPSRIGVAATARKARAIFAALRGGYIRTLVTDEAAAREILRLFDETFHRA